MNKKYLSVILFSALMLGTAGTFTSCKDYDDDIANLQGQVDKLNELQSTVEGLQTSISEAKTAAEQAKTDAATALTTAQEALEKAEQALANAGGSGDTSALQAQVDGLQAQVEALENTIAEQNEKIAKLDDLNTKVAELENKLNTAATEEDLTKLQEELTQYCNQLMNIVGGRLSSITLIPEMHINGIPAITFRTLQYTPQVYVKNEHKDHIGNEGFNHSSTPWLDHKDAGESMYISTEKNKVNYQLNPNMGIMNDDVETPSFDCIESKNITTKAANIMSGDEAPLAVTGYDIKDGVMEVTFKKNEKWLNTLLGTTGDAHAGNKEEKFYMASLKTPIAEENLTEAEKTAGEDVYVNSEYSRIEEIIAIPYLANSRTQFDKAISGTFADETQTDEDGSFFVHYHDSICLYNSENDELVDVYAPYNELLDLSKLVTVCTSEEADDHSGHAWLENYADYGLEFRFALASAKYLQGDLKTDEQEFGRILNDHFLKSEVYDIDLADDEFSKTSIGREPIVRVSLVDAKNNNLVAQRYIKVRWTGEKSQTIPAYTFDNDVVTCHDMWQQLFSQGMNEAVYHQIKFDGGQSISKTQFHSIYTKMEIAALRKDGQKVDLSTLNISTDPADWNEGSDRAEKDGGEQILNNYDLVFAMLQDAEDNTSYNLVWAMNPKTVGTLSASNGYASTYEIDVVYVDESGLNGNINQTFKQTIVAPTQQFAYQGTYWADGKGEGVFNVNPIVFNTNNDGWVGSEQLHVYPGLSNGCELKDYSHIEADLVNGYK